MYPRPFDWRDIPHLHTYRNKTVYLHAALLLTRGPLQTLGAMLSSLVPAVGIFTSVYSEADETDHPIIGQLIHNSGEPFGHLSFLAPEDRLSAENLPPLIEHLLAQGAGRGMLRVLAEVNEHSPAIDGLRRAGFAIYTRQRVWRLADAGNGNAQPAGWREVTEADTFAIRLLYSNLVPGLVQQVETTALQTPRGLVFYKEGELLAYVELHFGLVGIIARPYVHPDVEDAAPDLINLLQNLPSRHVRPVYVCVSAYQGGLEPVLQAVGAQPGERQVIMAKHLTLHKRVTPALTLPAIEGTPESFALFQQHHHGESV